MRRSPVEVGCDLQAPGLLRLLKALGDRACPGWAVDLQAGHGPGQIGGDDVGDEAGVRLDVQAQAEGGAAGEQGIRQQQVEAQLAAKVVQQQVHPPARQGFEGMQGGAALVDQQVGSSAPTPRFAAAIALHGPQAEVGLVGPQGQGEQAAQPLGGRRQALRQGLRQRRGSLRQAELLLQTVGVNAVARPRLKIAGRLQDAAVKKHLGGEKRQLQPALPEEGTQDRLPIGPIRRLLVQQGAHPAVGQVGGQGAQAVVGWWVKAVLGDDAAGNFGQAAQDGICRKRRGLCERASLGATQRRGDGNLGHGV